jgi:dUTP pyrophosphatase
MKTQINFIKLDTEAQVPTRAKDGDAGFDLVAIDDGVVDSEGFIQYRTGLSIQPIQGIHTEIWPRSSISKYDMVLANSIGLIDNGYRGEILIRFKPTLRYSAMPDGEIYVTLPKPFKKYQKGDKIAQLVVSITVDASFVEVQELTETNRGSGGFGSSGK